MHEDAAAAAESEGRVSRCISKQQQGKVAILQAHKKPKTAIHRIKIFIFLE